MFNNKIKKKVEAELEKAKEELALYSDGFSSNPMTSLEYQKTQAKIELLERILK